MRSLFFFGLSALSVVSAIAETHTLTMREAIARALAENTEVVMARLDEQKSEAQIHIARDPFIPRIGVGSGLAYSNGFPLSIEGSAPAALQGRANQYLYNQPQRFQVKQAQENAKGAGFITGMKRDEIAFRVASLYLDVERASRLIDTAAKQVDTLKNIVSTVQARVDEGRALSIELKEANVNLLRAKARLLSLQSDGDQASRNLAATLGFPPQDSIRPSDAAVDAPAIPTTEQAALDTALASNKDLKRLETSLAAKGYEVKGAYAQRLPRIDMIAQYALLTRFSNYDEYFRKFQRNNGQIGASIQIPFLLGPGVKAVVQQAEADQKHLEAEMLARRNQIALDMHQTYLDLQKAETAKELAQADLDLARSQLSVILAQVSEGRASLRQVEESRFNENEKWIAFYDAQYSAERAKYNVLRQTGELAAALH